jgi:hypothetical protein
MPFRVAGKIVLPTSRQIALSGKTVLTLNPEDVLLEITSATGTTPTPSLAQLYPAAPALDFREGRMLWIWNNTAASVNLGYGPLEIEYGVTPWAMPFDSLIAGRVLCFRYYVHGGLPGSLWPSWNRT